MSRRRGTAAATALLLAAAAALAAAGCGLGPGSGVGSVELTVTREFGTVPMLERSLEASESDTVMRLLEGNVDVSTRYGGGYVHAIEGIAEAQRGGSPYDWFYYVNGVLAPIGAADTSVEGGERVWWDYHDWKATETIPAVVGSWPAPFAGGYEGRKRPTALECEGGGAACARVRAALEGAGAEVLGGASEARGKAGGEAAEGGGGAKAPAGAIRVLVGPWARLRSDPVAATLESGPAVSGVFARFEPAPGGGYRLRALDEEGDHARLFRYGAGLVAATRHLEGPPVWVITGTTPAAVGDAARLLTAAKLRDHYAVASEGGKATPLPVPAR